MLCSGCTVARELWWKGVRGGGKKKKKKNLSKNARVPWRGIRAEFTAHSIHPGLLLVISALFHAGELSVYELCVHVSPILTNTQRFEC